MRLPHPGDRLGGRTHARFEIQERLGGGAMGSVFRAWDSELHRVVALKFLHPRVVMAEERLRSLLREEARAIARLDHENIVRVFDVSEWEGRPWEPWVPFVVMEHLEGETLAALLLRARPGPRRTLEIMDAVSAGLAHAHEHHIVHRDLKPSNVFITRRGQVKLIDFGLAHVTVSTAPSAPHLPTAGTPPYMAPEQWRGETQDERTDVWAAGVMLFEMLTGELPVSGSNLAESRARVLSAEPMPSVRERRPELPRELEPLLARALEKEPARRFRSATEFRTALLRTEESLGPWRGESRTGGPQRRQVTLVCCRLERMSDSPEAFDPEDSIELEASFQRICTGLLREEGASMASCVGEQVLACFGDARAREDDSEHAVRAGLRLVEALQHALPRLSPVTLAIKVGIHTDLAVLGELSVEGRESTPAIQGEAPQLAVWLARNAEPGTVVLSDTTWTLTHDAFETESRSPLAYAGLFGARDVPLHRVLRERRTQLRFDRSSERELTPLVGRTLELKRLQEVWETARSGRGSCLLLRGEAGMGKSRLLRELRQCLSSEPHTPLLGQCWAQFSTSAFHPITDMLQYLFALPPDGEPALRLQALEARLVALGLVPEHRQLIAAFLSLPVPEQSPHSRWPPQLLKERTFEALAALVQRLCEERPVLAILEDLHWADPSTLELLGFLLARADAQRLCVLLSARPPWMPAWSERPGFQVLALERLPAELTEALIQAKVGGRGLTPERIAHLAAQTDGVPLFIEEIARTVLARSPPGVSSATGADAIPLTLHELLLARLDGLPRRRKALAQLCAVVGRGLEPALLSVLTGHSEATLLQEFSELLASGLLQLREGGGPPRYEFRHALLQEAAVQSLPRGVRRQHHQRIAEALAMHFPEVAKAQPEQLAHHYTEARDLAAAVHWWALAGERASRRSANTEAIAHFTRALTFLRQLPESPERTQEELRLRIGLGLPMLQVHGYGAPEVERIYAPTPGLCREVGDALSRIELSYWSLFHYLYARARFDVLQALGELLVDVGRRQHSRELLVLGHRAIVLAGFTVGDSSLALEHVAPALANSDFDLEQHRTLAVRHWINPRVATFSFASILEALRCRPDRSAWYRREALALAERIAHPNTSAFALVYAAVSSQMLHDPRGVLDYASASLVLSQRHGLQLWLGWCAMLRSWAEAKLFGHVQQGLAAMTRGLALLEGSGVLTTPPFFLGLIAELHRALGQSEAGLAATREGLQWSERSGEHSADAELLREQAELSRQLGREEEASASFARALAVARHQRVPLFELRALVGLARQLQDAGRPEEARRRLDALCGRFGPELDCTDLAEARELLASLSLEVQVHGDA
ncbi:protein kinase domain-containing protein [Melittangium boletus]|uniref:protein kinase domain-containing protein n=1 Tax=Melittangium boletus TaxID=83453 RepID=UPI0014727021|nr:protein kinase [Melittangium boletus]